MSGWFETDRLQRERGKTGLEWMYARTINSIYRPSAKCIIRDSRKEIEKNLDVLRQQEKPALKKFETEKKKCQNLVLVNQNPEAIAKKVQYCNILRNGYLRVLDGINTLTQAENQLQEVEILIKEQGTAFDLVSAVKIVNQKYATNRGRRVGLRYTMEKDILQVQSEEIQESWEQEPAMTPEGNAQMIDNFINENMLTRPDAEACYRHTSPQLDMSHKTLKGPNPSARRVAECHQERSSSALQHASGSSLQADAEEYAELQKRWQKLSERK